MSRLIVSRSAEDRLATALAWLRDEADRLDKAIASVLASGTRTKDIAAPGTNAVGTQDVGDAIVRELEALS